MNLHLRPFRCHNRESRRIAWREVRGQPMRAENALEFASDALDCSARTLVPDVSVQTNPKHLPHLESERQHEELGFGVGRRANCRRSEPRVSDLTPIWSGPAVQRVTFRPCPLIEIKKAGRTDNGAVAEPNDREGQRAGRLLPSDGRFHISRGFRACLRHGAPLIQRGIGRGGARQTIDMSAFQGFETDRPSLQNNIGESHTCMVRIVARCIDLKVDFVVPVQALTYTRRKPRSPSSPIRTFHHECIGLARRDYNQVRRSIP